MFHLFMRMPEALCLGVAGLVSSKASDRVEADEPKPTPNCPPRAFITPGKDFKDVSRGKPVPHTLVGDALVNARLTAETWRLEIVAEGEATVEKPRRLDDATALDLPALEELGRTHGVRFLKAMQCNNIAQPLGQGLGRGAAARGAPTSRADRQVRGDLLLLGFHNNDPEQMFRVVAGCQPGAGHAARGASAVCGISPQWSCRFRCNEAGRCEWWCPGRTASSRSNGSSASCLTNDYQANDTYALKNNDPESYLKTAAISPTSRRGAFRPASRW